MSNRTLQQKLCQAIDAAKVAGELDEHDEKELLQLSVALKGFEIRDVEKALTS